MSLSAHSTHQRLDILACSQQTQIRNEPLKHKRSQISHTQKKIQKPIKDSPAHNPKTQSQPKTNLLDPKRTQTLHLKQSQNEKPTKNNTKKV